MEKLKLPNVTLLCIDCVNVTRAINVVEKCKSVCDFGAVKLLTSIPNDYPEWVEIMPLTSLVAYSVFMLTDSYKYIDTSHVLIVQRDGWILNPNAWKDEWLNYDYVAPLFIQYDHVGSGGFSLRSRSLMESAAKSLPVWNGTQEDADRIHFQHVGLYEDGYLSFNMQSHGFKYPSNNEAALFAQGGNPNSTYYQPNPFGFHGAIQNINHETGLVSPVCSHYTSGQSCECSMPHLLYLGEMGKSIKTF
jgi:hypothetical protein